MLRRTRELANRNKSKWNASNGLGARLPNNTNTRQLQHGTRLAIQQPRHNKMEKELSVKKNYIVTFPYNHTLKELKKVKKEMQGSNYFIVFTTDSGEIKKTEVDLDKFKEYLVD